MGLQRSKYMGVGEASLQSPQLLLSSYAPSASPNWASQLVFGLPPSGAGGRASTAGVPSLATARLRCAKVAMASVTRFS